MQRTSPIAGFLGGLVFIAISLVCLFYICKAEIFSCSRANNVCYFMSQGVFSSKKNIDRQVELSSIRDARIESQTTTSSNGSRSTTYSVVLDTSQGVVPLSSYSTSNYSSLNNKTQKINNYIKSNDPSLEIVDNKILIRVMMFVFLALGIMILLSSFGQLLALLVTIFFMIKKNK